MNQSTPATTKIRGPYQPPQKLQTVILCSPSGDLYELPAAAAEQFKVSSARLGELGHPPLLVQSEKFPEGSEVAGHHKVPGSSGASGTDWCYHTTWEYGCFHDQTSGGFAIGFHRHPYSDERAIGAEAQDFA